MQRKWTNGSVSSVCTLDSDLNQLYTPAIPTGASSVLDLTNKFNNNNNNSSSCSGEAGGLKRVASVSSGEQFSVSRLEDRIVLELDTGRGLGAYLRCVLAAVCGGDAAAAATDKRLGYMEALVRLLQHHPGLPSTEPDRELGLRMREVRIVRIVMMMMMMMTR